MFTKAAKEASRWPSHPPIVSARRIRVYLTDDDQQFLLAVQDLLSQEAGVVLVGSANSLDETFRDLPRARADVLVLDLYLPGSATLECLSDLKRLAPTVKVLVISGGGWMDQQVESALAGANGFLYKPFTSSDLVQAIRMVHSGKAYFDSSALGAALNRRARLAEIPSDSLSPEDREFLALVGQGMTNMDIAAAWKTGVKAVYQRRYRLKTKLGLHSARALTRYAMNFAALEISK